MVFYGENFLPEYETGNAFPRNPNHNDYVRSGRLYTLSGSEDYKPYFDDPSIGPSRHFTYIFNTFVLLQLFNELNCRKLGTELNIFARAFANGMFWMLWVFTLVAQVVIVEVGSKALSVHEEGLTAQQWGICIGLGATPLAWRVVLVSLPDWKKVGKLSYRPPRGDTISHLTEPPKRRSPRNLKAKVVLMD
jgi:Ca2+ transporting ATPase